MFMFVSTLVFIFIIRLRFPSKVSIATNFYWFGPKLKEHPRSMTMKDVASTDRLLGGQPLAPTDFAVLVEASHECHLAVQKITVQPREDLLVTFAINT